MARGATDDRGRPVRLYGSPLSFFRLGDTTIPPDVQRRISWHARKRRPGVGVAIAGLGAQLFMFGAIIWYARWAAWRSGAHPFGVLAGGMVGFALIGFAILWLVYRHVRHARTPVMISAFLAERRCPACGYDLAGVHPGSDGFTICPERAAAWRLEPSGVGAE